MHGLGPRKARGQAHTSSAHHGPHLKLAARNTQNITPVTLPANGCAGYCTGRNSIVTAPSFASAGMGGGTPLCGNLGLRSGKHRHAGFKPLAYISNIHARLQKQQQRFRAGAHFVNALFLAKSILCRSTNRNLAQSWMP